jgi:hypothetical protein
VGEIILAKADGELPMRKLTNAVARVHKGEQSQQSEQPGHIEQAAPEKSS